MLFAHRGVSRITVASVAGDMCVHVYQETEIKRETETDRLKRRQQFISLSLRSLEMGKHRTLLFETFRSLVVKANNLIQQIKADQNNPAFTNSARIFKQLDQALYGKKKKKIEDVTFRVRYFSFSEFIMFSM